MTFVKNDLRHGVLVGASFVWLFAFMYALIGVMSRLVVYFTDIHAPEGTTYFRVQASSEAFVDTFWPVWALTCLVVTLVLVWFVTFHQLFSYEEKLQLFERIKKELAGIKVLTTEGGYVEWNDKGSFFPAAFRLTSRGDMTFVLTMSTEDIHHVKNSTRITFAYAGNSFSSSGGCSTSEMRQLHNILKDARKNGRQLYPVKPARIAEKRRYNLMHRGKLRHPVWF